VDMQPEALRLRSWRDTSDKNFLDPGKIGIWTKADSVTYFDA
jgi:hypothetical protein